MYRAERSAGETTESWAAFLARHSSGTPKRFTPRSASVRTLAGVFERYRRLVAAQPNLDAAVAR
jgi:hypothetical protein